MNRRDLLTRFIGAAVALAIPRLGVGDDTDYVQYCCDNAIPIRGGEYRLSRTIVMKNGSYIRGCILRSRADPILCVPPETTDCALLDMHVIGVGRNAGIQFNYRPRAWFA